MGQADKLDSETYPQPAHGWTCFHCGETFTTVGAAQLHFGATPDEMAACVIKAGREKGLLMALRAAEDEIAKLRVWNSERENLARLATLMESDIKRYFAPHGGPQVHTVFEAFQVFDAMEGRAIAAEEELAKMRHEIIKTFIPTKPSST